MIIGNIDQIYSLHSEFIQIREKLRDHKEFSLSFTVENNFRKILLIAAASHFEQSLMNAVQEFTKKVTCQGHPLEHLVKNKAIARQYHSWFDWNSQNANRFFSLFGDDFKSYMSQKINEDTELEKAIRAFLEIGQSRNQLVHGDFVTVTLEKTTDEIQNLYKDAVLFVERFPEDLENFVCENFQNRQT